MQAKALSKLIFRACSRVRYATARHMMFALDPGPFLLKCYFYSFRLREQSESHLILEQQWTPLPCGPDAQQLLANDGPCPDETHAQFFHRQDTEGTASSWFTGFNTSSHTVFAQVLSNYTMAVLQSIVRSYSGEDPAATASPCLFSPMLPAINALQEAHNREDLQTSITDFEAT